MKKKRVFQLVNGFVLAAAIIAALYIMETDWGLWIVWILEQGHITMQTFRNFPNIRMVPGIPRQSPCGYLFCFFSSGEHSCTESGDGLSVKEIENKDMKKDTVFECPFFMDKKQGKMWS